MTGKQFKDWMIKEKIRVPDVASKTGLDPNTVYSFRRGKSVSPNTVDKLIEFYEQYEPIPTRRKEAVG